MAEITDAVNGSGYRVPYLGDGSVEQQLQNYLEERDYGFPSKRPGLKQKIELGSANILCEIEWDYDQIVPPRGIPADGFLVWIGYTATAGLVVPRPTVIGAKVSEKSRKFAYPVPAGIAVRFGVQAYRETHQGEFRGELFAPDEWICDNRASCTVIRYHLVFTETFNNGDVDPTLVTRTFVPRDQITLDAVTIHTVSGIAQASVFKGNSLMPYGYTEDPWEPPTGCWTLDGDGKIKVQPEDAPWPNDYFGVESAVICP